MKKKDVFVEINKTAFLDAMWNCGFGTPGCEKTVYLSRIRRELGEAQRLATIRRKA